MGAERRELLSPLPRLLVTSVLAVQETGWELTAAGRRLSTPVLLTLLVFLLVILKISGCSEPNVPCTDVSIDFKLCKLYCLKIFVKWLNWTFSKGALSISKLTTFKCIFLLLLLYSVSSCAQICSVCPVVVIFLKLEIQPVCLCWKLPSRIVLPDTCVFPAQRWAWSFPRWRSGGCTI